MEQFLVFVAGLIFGSVMILILKYVRTKPPQTSGDLIIDNSDPYDGPHMMLNLTPDGLRELPGKEYVFLKVRMEDFISQK